MIHSAVEAVVVDKAFTVPSPLAVNALESAKLFLAGSRVPENQSQFGSFASEIVAHLINAFPANPSARQCKPKIQREEMWGSIPQHSFFS